MAGAPRKVEDPGDLLHGTRHQGPFSRTKCFGSRSAKVSRVHVFLLTYLTESVHKVVSQKLIPAQIRQLILDASNDKGQVDEFVRE